MSLKAVFRTDASLDIGTGHVMRCLALADALRDTGGDCQFICRGHSGHLIEEIRARGYKAHTLAPQSDAEPRTDEIEPEAPRHARWLGASQKADVLACNRILKQIQPDWLIVDHYALDAWWESAQRAYCRKLMVIDDLADRAHDCDLLLDQTFGRPALDYQGLVPQQCMLLCGSRYALLRPEFAQWRPYSLVRRQRQELKHLLITMGGIDRDNATGKILDALAPGCLPNDCHISVVMGKLAPWLDQVQQKAEQLPWTTRVLVGVTEMAHLMADSDLAIGAAGSTSWERCCLGLPTLLTVLAENQSYIAGALENACAVRVVDLQQSGKLISSVLQELSAEILSGLSHGAANICDGAGSIRVVESINICSSHENQHTL